MFKFSKAALLLVLVFSLASDALADTVILKNGTKHEGKITLQTPDIVKIKVQITEAIAETKTFGTNEIQEIVKQAADNVAFIEIQKMVPTRSLLSAENYRTMLRSGPDDFLSRFESSKHKVKVEEFKVTLEKELDLVERGNIQLEGVWYSPQDRIDFEKLIESKIVLLKMKANLNGRRYNNFILAMRRYEALESKYFGTPAHAEGVKIAKQITPILRSQIQNLRRDVDVKNRQWEADKNVLNETDRLNLENARKREETRFAAAVAADKRAKLKWTAVNPRSASNLDSYISFVSSEMDRISKLDANLLAERASKLMEVDEMIRDDQLMDAEEGLSRALEMPVSKSGGKGSSRKGSSTYPSALSMKLQEKFEEKEKMMAAAEKAKASEKLTANLKQTQQSNKVDDERSAEDDAADGETVDSADSEQDDVDQFALLAAASSKKKVVAEPAKTESKKKTKSKPKKKKAKARSTASRKFPTHLIVPILTGLLVVGIVVAKFTGIGSKE